MTTPTPPRNLLRRIHMFRSMRHLPLPWQEGEQPMLAWLDTLPPPSEDDEPTLIMAVATDGGAVTWSAHGPTGLMIPHLARWLPQGSTPDDELRQLAAAGPLLRPDRVGMWVEQLSETADRGWFFPVRRPATDTRLWTADHNAGSQLMGWAETWKVTHVAGLRRCTSAEAPWTELEVPLPGQSGDAQLGALGALMERLNQPALPDPLVEKLASLVRGVMGVQVRLSTRGCEALTLRIPQPGPTLTDALVGGDLISGKVRAAFEEDLGVAGPEALGLEVHRDGKRVVLHYRPGSAPSEASNQSCVHEALQMAAGSDAD